MLKVLYISWGQFFAAWNTKICYLECLALRILAVWEATLCRARGRLWEKLDGHEEDWNQISTDFEASSESRFECFSDTQACVLMCAGLFPDYFPYRFLSLDARGPYAQAFVYRYCKNHFFEELGIVALIVCLWPHEFKASWNWFLNVLGSLGNCLSKFCSTGDRLEH